MPSLPVVFRRCRRRWLALAWLVLVAMLAAGTYSGYVLVHARRSITLPTHSGPFAVGRVISQWSDLSRQDELAPTTPDAARRLAVWIWYPSIVSPGATAAYVPGLWAGLQLSSPVGLAESDLSAVRTHASTAATAAAGKFPVVVFEPGLGLAAPQYTALAESIASLGYVVVASTPTYSANLSVIDDQVVNASERGNPAALDGANLHEGDALRAADDLLQVWVADAHFVAAAARATVDQPYSGHLMPSETVYLGHSFGGASALEACRTDQSCAGAIDVDGTQFGDVVREGLDRPFMMIASGDGCLTGTCTPHTDQELADRDTAQTLLLASTSDAWCYTIGAAGHFDFTDYDAYYLARPLQQIIPLGNLARSRVLVVSTALVSAFLDEVFNGHTPQFAGLERRFPELTLLRRPG